MDWYDASKDVGVGLIGTVLGGLGIAFKLKPRLDRAVEDIQVLKEHELVRVQKDLDTLRETLRKEVVLKEQCETCNKDICYRLDDLKTMSLEVRLDIKELLKRT